MDEFQNKMVKKLINHIEMTLSDKDKVEQTMIAAAGVIYKYGENGEKMVLLIQRAADDHWPLHWEFPRGKCDKPIGERVDKCALREIKEECGLDVEIEKFIDKFQYLADGGKRRTICYNFLCKIKNPDQEVKLSKEHENHMWVTNLGQVDLMVMPEQRKTLEMILSTDNPIISTPKNTFTMNNNIEEFLKRVQEQEEENKPLNKPFRLPSGSNKKFGVYVKNDKGNVVKVTFGDPNLEIKRDDPERLKSFRARHGCDNPGPKWKAKYWSCKFWEKGISVTDLLKGNK